MATYKTHHQYRCLQGLPPLSVEDLPSPSELDYPSLGNQSPRSNIESVRTSHDLSLPKDFFTKGFIPPYNPPIDN